MSVRHYLRHVGTLFGGTVLAQLINLLSYPLLTRTYDAATFGQFAIYLSTASILGTVACLRFDIVVQAAPFAQRLVAHRLSLIFSFAVGALAALAYSLVRADLVSAALLGLAIFLTGVTLSAQALLIKHQRYGASAAAAVVRTLLTAVPQVLLFWVLPGPLGLMLGYCLGALAQWLWQVRALRDEPRRAIGARKLATLFRRYRAYPTYDLPGALLATAALWVGNYLVFDLYGAAAAGIFALAFRLAMLPLALAASNLSEVYFQRASAAYTIGDRLGPLLRLNLRLASIVAVASVIAILVAAQPVIDIYLGADWAGVAPVLIALTPMLAARLLSASVNATPLVLRRPQLALVANGALLCALLLAAIVASAGAMEFMSYLWLTSALTAVVHVAYVLFLDSAVARYDANRPRNSSGAG